MSHFYVFTTGDEVHLASGRTARAALNDFDCPRGETVVGMILKDAVLTPYPNATGLCFVATRMKPIPAPIQKPKAM